MTDKEARLVAQMAEELTGARPRPVIIILENLFPERHWYPQTQGRIGVRTGWNTGRKRIEG